MREEDAPPRGIPSPPGTLALRESPADAKLMSGLRPAFAKHRGIPKGPAAMECRAGALALSLLQENGGGGGRLAFGESWGVKRWTCLAVAEGYMRRWNGIRVGRGTACGLRAWIARRVLCPGLDGAVGKVCLTFGFLKYIVVIYGREQRRGRHGVIYHQARGDGLECGEEAAGAERYGVKCLWSGVGAGYSQGAEGCKV